MGDLIRNAADLPVVIIGATTTGVATTPVASDTTGDLHVILPDGTQQTAVTAAFTAAGNNLIFKTNGASQCSFQATGTWSGLIAAYVSCDGTTYFDVPLFSWVGFSIQTYSGDTNLYSINVGGFQYVKIDAVTLTSGTANVIAWLNAGNGPTIVTSPLAASFQATVLGSLTNNTVPPTSDNLGVLGHLAEGTINASRYTTGDQVLAVTDLAGNTNVDLQYYKGTAVSTTNPIATTITDGTNTLTAALSAYGTAPTGTYVEGVNAYITGGPADSFLSGTITSTGQNILNLNPGNSTFMLMINAAIGTSTIGVLASNNGGTSTILLPLIKISGTNTTPPYEFFGSSGITGVAGVQYFIGQAAGFNQIILNTATFGTGDTTTFEMRGSNGTGNTPYIIAPPITKATQGTTGYTVQNLLDAGRNQTNYYMAIQIVSTATDTLMSLTGYKANAAVGATTTPVVVTTGKTYRLNSITMDYTTIVTTPGSVRFTLRANTSGVVAIGSPAVCTWEVGEPTGIAPVAGKKNTVTIPIPDGMEFAAGTGIGVSMLGLNTTGVGAAVGYGRITLNGFEY